MTVFWIWIYWKISPFARTPAQYRPIPKAAEQLRETAMRGLDTAPAPRGAFKSEVHRFAVASLVSSYISMRSCLVEDLYISRGYPRYGHPRIKGSKRICVKKSTRLGHQGITTLVYPTHMALKYCDESGMAKTDLGMVSEAMRSVANTICEEERDAWVSRCRETGDVDL